MSSNPQHVAPARQIRTLAELATLELDAELAAEAARNRLEAVRQAIREHPDTHGPDKYAAGDRTIVISKNQRFNPGKAEELIRQYAAATGTDPDKAVQLATEPRDPVVTRKRVEVLYGDDLAEQATDIFDDKVSVK